MKSNSSTPKIKPQFSPVLSEQNCPQFRHLKENLAPLGVKPRRLGRKDYLLTHEVLEALERVGVTPESDSDIATVTPITEAADPAAAVRAMLGKKRAGGQ